MMKNQFITVSSFFVIFFTIAILFGAPFYNKLLNTVLWTTCITIMTVLPSIIILPMDINKWINHFILNESDSWIGKWCVMNFYSVLAGSWAGSVLLLLDWNTIWQVWPFPCCIGSVVGSVLNVIVLLAIQVFTMIRSH